MGINGFLASIFILLIIAVAALFILTTPGVPGKIASYLVGHFNQVLTSSQNQTLASTCQDSVQSKLDSISRGLPPSVEMGILNATAFDFGNNNGQNINLIDNWLSQWSLVRNSSQGPLTTSLMCPGASQLGYICGEVGNITTPAAGVVVRLVVQHTGSTLTYRIPVICSAQGNLSTITPASSAYLSSEIPSLAG